MPLSRHFYSLDEVQAALYYTTSNNHITESLFWCKELILSGFTDEIISILFKSWLWNVGSMQLNWLIDAWNKLSSEDISEEDILQTTYNLSSINYLKKDNSLWNIIVLNNKDPDKIPDKITKKIPNIFPSDNIKEKYFISSIYQGKARCACWISQYINDDRIWEMLYWYVNNFHEKWKEQYIICLDILQNYDKLLGYKNDEYDIIIKYTAILSLCIPSNTKETSFKKLETEIDNKTLNILNKLSDIIGKRSRRCFNIPIDWLYGVTQRGRTKWTKNNLKQLYNIEKYLIGCPFWDEVLQEYADIDEKGKINWKSDEKSEEFYRKYFPDDIPDEWSKNDQNKSHGDGILGPYDKINILKYSKIYMKNSTRFAWNTTKKVHNYLENIDINDCILEHIIKIYKKPADLTENDLKKLEPVTKIKCI